MFKTVEKPLINRKKTSFNTPAATEESSCNLSAAADFADRSIRYHKESPMPVVQMIRKRVKDETIPLQQRTFIMIRRMANIIRE